MVCGAARPGNGLSRRKWKRSSGLSRRGGADYVASIWWGWSTRAAPLALLQPARPPGQGTALISCEQVHAMRSNELAQRPAPDSEGGKQNLRTNNHDAAP